MESLLRSRTFSIVVLALNLILLVIIIIYRVPARLEHSISDDSAKFETAAYVTEDQLIKDDILLIDKNLDTISILSCISRSPLFVISYSENDCNTCFDELQQSAFLRIKDVGYDKLIIIGEFNSIRNFLSFIKQHQFPFDVFYFDQVLNPNRKIRLVDGLYAFVLDKTGSQRSAFFPSSNAKRTEDYIDIMMRKYFGDNFH
jgi:hypothetical protein